MTLAHETTARGAGRCVHCEQPYHAFDAVVYISTHRIGLTDEQREYWHAECWKRTHAETLS